MLKVFLLSTSFLTINPMVITSIYYTVVEPTNNYIIPRDVLRQDILAKRVYGGQINYHEYDGQTFHSDEALNEYLLKNNKVTTVLTSSNPNQIIKNYEHMTLDSKKIYDVDLNNFQQLYRDAFGNVAYSRQDALNTYTNAGLVKAQYSYDGFYWFDTPEEAKINEKYKMKINKSLYYIYNNQYYNAFNDQDINTLVSLMEEGYYTNLNQSLLGKPLVNPIIHQGNSKLIYDLLKKDLQKDFNGDYYNAVTKTETKYQLALAATGTNRITAQYYDQNNKLIKAIDYNAGSSLTIELTGLNVKSGQELIDYFKNDTWNEEWEGPPSIGRYYKTRDFTGSYKGQNVKIRLNLVPRWSYGGGKTQAPSINEYNIIDQSVGKIKLYANPQQNHAQFLDVTHEKKGVFSNSNITTTEKNQFYDIWYDHYFNSFLTNFGSNNNRQVTYHDIKNGNYITNPIFNNTKGKGFIYKDKAYDVNNSKGYSQSLIRSYLNWMPIKAKLLEKPVVRDGQQYYQLRPDFLATAEQLDKFLYLEGNFQTKLMYSYSPDPDISDRNGRMLASTLEGAKEKELINKDRTLRKQYLAYDVFGNKEVTTSSAEEAIQQLTNKIQLTSKFVHKNEIKTWNAKVKRSWDLIISDGRYVVYRIVDPNQTGKFIYFPAQDLALAAIKTTARLNYMVNKLEKSVYLYSYTTQSKELVPFVFYDNDVESVISKIYQYEQWT